MRQTQKISILLFSCLILGACTKGFQTEEAASSSLALNAPANTGDSLTPSPASPLPSPAPTPLPAPAPTPAPMPMSPAADANDMLTWVHSQLPATTYVAVHAESRKCIASATISRYYQDGLGRSASTSEISYYTTLLASGSNFKTIRRGIANSPEFLNSTASSDTVIRRAYNLLLLRNASTAEVNFYLQSLAQGLSRQQLINAISNSPEFKTSFDCYSGDTFWGNVTDVYQPFKSVVNRNFNHIYWRKDSMADWYGEIFSFDNNSIYLRSETFPVFEGLDKAWDERIDKFRLFAPNPSERLPGGQGRLISKRQIDTNWRHSATLNTYACYSFQEYTSGTCQLFQQGVNDSRIFIEKLNQFSTVFDGENPDAKWAATADFKSFDEVVVWHQEMDQGMARERFFFAKKNGQYYGIVRWDNSKYDPATGQFRVIDRTVGLRLLSDPAFSLKGMETRSALEK